MRKGILLLGLLLVGVGLLGSSAGMQEVPEEAKFGGKLIIHSGQTLKDLNPMVCNDVYSFYAVYQMFDRLIALDPETLEPKPFLAKSWELSEDGLELTLYLHEGVMAYKLAEDGTVVPVEEINAEDVVFTFEWIADPANASPNMPKVTGWMEKVEALDDYTVKFTLKFPYAPILARLNYFGIVPKDTFLEMGAEAFNSNPVGSGPFVFKEWRRGEILCMVKNPYYWIKEPYLDEVCIKPIPELATAVLALEKGEIDITDMLPAPDIPRLRENPDIVVDQCPSLTYFYVGFNDTLSPYNDVRFRKAVYQSFSMDEAVESIFMGLTGIRAYGAVPPTLWANDREWLRENAALPENDEEAEKLFAELREEGVLPEPFRPVIYTPPDPRRIKLATIIATNLIVDHHIEAAVQPLEWGAYLDLLYRSEEKPEGEAGIYIIGWGYELPDPDDGLYPLFHSDNAIIGSANNMSFYKNPEVDALIDKARSTLDRKVREENYVKAQRIIFGQDYVHIPAYHYIETNGVRTWVHDFKVSAMGDMRICDPFVNVWVDERSPRK